ncbi:MAG: hypothetical protein Tp178MES00d2C33159851_3 [Prokaryotic dsDNA virus sp.]|nr:MAG: hypothetical protein Tp178MES00d2C33159851_3 [Prokaryotic dsDNA virus sp.]|tara:strand:- start:90918 stop:91169 length:252 start_codon:yes stop_codon:yes gene_type:complete
MKVKDLIALLKEYDEEAEVVIQSDQEGNGYQELRGADEDSYLFDGDDTSFLSQYNNIDDMAEDLGEDVHDLLGSLNDVVVLYP